MQLEALNVCGTSKLSLYPGFPSLKQSHAYYCITDSDVSTSRVHIQTVSKTFNGKAVRMGAKSAAPKSVRIATTAALKAATSLPLELEEGEMPMNTWKNKSPLSCKVKSCERIVGPKATGETCHIIIETDGKAPMWEGQSYGVVPPVSS